MTNDDKSFNEKDIKQKYSTQYLIVKLNNSPNLEKKLLNVEIGLLLVGSVMNDIEYEVDDQANFLGQFKYNKIKFNESQYQEVFFSIIHSNEIFDKQ